MKRLEMSQSTSVPKPVDLPWKPMLVERAHSYLRLLHQGSYGSLEKYATQRHETKVAYAVTLAGNKYNLFRLHRWQIREVGLGMNPNLKQRKKLVVGSFDL
jgi:hypothetical protein